VDLRTWIIDDHIGLADRFERSIGDIVPVERWKERADGGGSSIAWLVLHTALHEDLAVSTACRALPPRRATWQADLGLGAFPAHAGLGEAEDLEVTVSVDLAALASFATEVHDDVQDWLAVSDASAFDDVPPATHRIEELAGISAASVPWLHTMWQGKSVGWFVRWESIGHRQGHLGEMISVRNRLGLSPF